MTRCHSESLHDSLSWTKLNTTRPYQPELDQTEHYQTISTRAGPNRTLPDHINQSWTKLNTTRPYQPELDQTEHYQTIRPVRLRYISWTSLVSLCEVALMPVHHMNEGVRERSRIVAVQDCGCAGLWLCRIVAVQDYGCAGYEIRDTHLVEESVLETLKVKADFLTFKPRPFNMREFYDRTGHDIKDMLLSCYYRGVECSAEDFKVVSRHVLCRLCCGTGADIRGDYFTYRNRIDPAFR
ncbi:hypothetical protein NFI96_022166 [Prochilodus magdalenae]|nr:hypothetical protein NFI96_022166 [Prochilodus magdalenae]